MNILQRIAATSILVAAPFLGAGCNSQSSQHKNVEYKLSRLGTINVSYMALFAENNDNTLSLEQAEKYVRADIFKACEKPTREELHKVIKIAAYVRNAGSQENLQITSRNLLAVQSKYMTEFCKRENKE